MVQDSTETSKDAIPPNPEQLVLKAREARRQKRLGESAALLEKALAQAPDHPGLHTELGRTLLVADQLATAAVHLDLAAKARPADAAVHLDLGLLRRRQHDPEGARVAFARALELDPGNAAAALNLAGALRALKQPEAALATLESLLVRQPDIKPALLEKAELLQDLGREQEALDFIDPLMHGKSVTVRLFDQWLVLMRRFGRAQEVVARMRELTLAQPLKVEFWLALGQSLTLIGRTDEAYAAYMEAHRLLPGNPRILFDLGVAERFRGNIEAAKEWVGQSLALKPDNPQGLRMFGIEHRYHYGDEAFRRLNTVAARIDTLPPKERVQLHYGLGKAFDDVEELETAFAHYAEGGRQHRKLVPYDEKAQVVLTRFIHALTPAVFESQPEPGFRSELPVFVLGMPRSGTSLLEQVLASHPAVFGAGELKLVSQVLQGIRVGRVRLDLQVKGFWEEGANVPIAERGKRYVEEIENLAPPGTQRIVDKMPGNFTYVGLIHMMLPDARIIHARRHPVETCLSCYRLLFTEGHDWSYDLRELGRYYRRYWDIMKHWRQTLPGRMLEVRYEDMVNDFETQARRIIDYLGLEWNEACLSFHETERAVRTASASQVRKPIYTTSTNRWRKYEQHLGPLLEEIGDIVEEYESEIAHLIEK